MAKIEQNTKTVYFQGEPYEVSAKEFDDIADFGADVIARELSPDQAVGYVLYVAGYIPREKYLSSKESD